MKKYVDETYLTRPIYKGAWTAENTDEGISAVYTEHLSLPAGQYIISITTPYSAPENEEDTKYTEKILITFRPQLNIQSGVIFIDACYGHAVVLGAFSSNAELKVVSGASTNKCTWSLLDRGGITAIKLS